MFQVKHLHSLYYTTTNTSGTFATNYGYDGLYRLTSANAAGLYDRTYTYNSLGNLLTKSDIGIYTYAGHTGISLANPHAAAEIGGEAVTYDDRGNILAVGDHTTYAWDYNNRLIESTVAGVTTSYLYNHTGRRVQKSVTGKETHYPFAHYEVVDGVAETNVYANDQLVATLSESDNNYKIEYAHPDHLNSTRLVTNEAGEVIQSLTYYPFGAEHTNFQTTNANQTNRYTGHDYDEETELSYMGARYYDGQVGRFTSQDPVALALGDWGTVQDKTGGNLGFYLQNPQTHNSYSYTANNPLKYADKNGEFIWVPFVVAGIIIGDQLMSATVLTDDANINAPTQNSSLLEIAAEQYGAPAGIVTAAALATDAYGVSKVKPQSIDNVISDIVDYAKKHDGSARPGHNGGGVFQNDGRNGSEVLPGFDKDGNSVSYRKYDVHPNSGGSRDSERVVTGSDGSVRYTDSHYKDFIEVD